MLHQVTDNQDKLRGRSEYWFSPTPRVKDPDMHHDMCVTHVPWCMSGSLTCGFFWSWWRGKRSRHSWRIRNPQFCVSGKRPPLAYVIAPSRSMYWDRYWTNKDLSFDDLRLHCPGRPSHSPLLPHVKLLDPGFSKPTSQRRITWLSKSREPTYRPLVTDGGLGHVIPGIFNKHG